MSKKYQNQSTNNIIRGFTLIELLATLTILVIIFLLVFPSVKNIISDSEDAVYQKQINTILNSTYDWSLENLSLLPSEDNTIYITLGQLKYDGYIEASVKDPKTGEEISDDYVISIKNVGSKYKNEDVYAKKNGDYLYKVEVELMNDDNYDANKPVITLVDLSVNSSGNYFTEVNQNDPYTDVVYTAVSSSGSDLTSKVVINIMYNDSLVENIDTSKVGIYNVNYTVIDNLGYANTVVNNVIIIDKEAPSIIIPSETTISKYVDSYDLMSGVSCSDNSGKCEIKIENSDMIDFGYEGKYVVKYIASDQSGNTSTIERLITIE